jgi:hypothetical protein
MFCLYLPCLTIAIENEKEVGQDRFCPCLPCLITKKKESKSKQALSLFALPHILSILKNK